MAIAAGEEHSLALLSSGTVMAWGLNDDGQLGDETSATHEVSKVPLPVSGLGGVTAIAAGGNHSLAVSALPTVTGIQPRGGPFTGGTSVSITGTNFTGATAVRFGSVDAVRFRLESAGSITAVSPGGAGTVDVTVTNGAGTSPTRVDDRFGYEPVVSGVQPDSGPRNGRTVLTITGKDLAGATAVRFGSMNAVRFRVISQSSVAAVSPSGTGTVNVTVTTPGGTSAISTADQFTYAVPGEWTIFPAPSLGAIDNGLDGISCASLAFCVAVGDDGPLGPKPAIEAWNGHAWSMSLAPPVSDKSGFSVGLHGVSCPSANFCAAVGSGNNAGSSPDSSGPFAVIDAWDGATWLVPQGRISGKVTLHGVSCVSSSFCVAVGETTGEGPSGPQNTVVASWNGTAWSRVNSPNPGIVDELMGVSCVSPTFCVAVGSHSTSVSPLNAVSLVESFNGTEWSVVPSPNRGTGNSALDGISCVSAKDCVAVGSGEGALVEVFNGSTWSIVETPHPEGSKLTAISCVAAGSCSAVGSQGATGPSQTLVETAKGGPASIVPSADGAGGATTLTGVTCLSAGRGWKPCFAVGSDEATPEGPLQSLVELGEI